MNRLLLSFLLVVACWLQGRETNAQNEFNLLHASGGIVYLTFDFDPAPSLSLGVARSFGIDALARDVTFYAELTKPLFLPGLANMQFESGSRFSLVASGDWNVVNRFSLIYHAEDNYLFTGRSLSAEAALLPGYYARHRYAGAEVGYTRFWRTRIRFKDDPDPARWYWGAGGKMTLGLIGGYTVDSRLDLTLRTGLVKTAAFRNFNPAGPPLYANAGIGYRY